jgi:hypothetical protein
VVKTGCAEAGGSIRATRWRSIGSLPSCQPAVNSRVSDDIPLLWGLLTPLMTGRDPAGRTPPSQPSSCAASSAGSRVEVVIRSGSTGPPAASFPLVDGVSASISPIFSGWLPVPVQKTAQYSTGPDGLGPA